MALFILSHLLLYVRGETAENSTLFSAFSLSHILLRLGTDSLFVKVCPKDPNHRTTKHSRSQDPKLKVPLPKKTHKVYKQNALKLGCARKSGYKVFQTVEFRVNLCLG